MSEGVVCDRTSVGIIARDVLGRILLVERKKFPFGWAPPSGHCDGHSYPVACFKRFEEETGLRVVGAPKPLIPKNPRKYFKCQRGGQYHDWQIFNVNWRGSLIPDVTEINGVSWYTVDDIKHLAKKTLEYLRKMKLAESGEEQSWVKGIQDSIEDGWLADPGLEPVWCEFFQELKIT